MTDVRLVKRKIREGQVPKLKDWMAEIREREGEAIETLENEGMHSEAAFIEYVNGEHFLIYYMKADDIDEVYESFENSSYDIDEQHKQVLDEVLEDEPPASEYELLYHLENPNRP